VSCIHGSFPGSDPAQCIGYLSVFRVADALLATHRFCQNLQPERACFFSLATLSLICGEIGGTPAYLPKEITEEALMNICEFAHRLFWGDVYRAAQERI
jgi:hypothetical protein